MMNIPPGMMQMLASLAVSNPQALATMAASRGARPPEGSALPLAPGPTSGMSPTQMINPAGAPTVAGAPAAVSVPQPAPGIGPQIAAAAPGISQALGGLAAPTAAQGGGGGGQAPAPFIPGALQPQTLQIMQALMGGAQQAPSLGSLILGR